MSTKIDILHDCNYNGYQAFSAMQVQKWAKFGLNMPLNLFGHYPFHEPVE
jgi:hypothetical protein